MIKRIKNALYTRKVLQQNPPTDIVHELTDAELKQLQACFLGILKDIDHVCKMHNITYMAAGGTALGAIRHQGFIPWDDDIDILMPRKDLQKFVEIFEETLGQEYEMTSPNSKYPIESLITAIYKKNTLKATFSAFNTPFPKGIHIDIFAIDAVPENKVMRAIKGSIAIILQFIAVSSLFYTFRSPEKKDFFYQTPAGRFNYRLRCFVGFIFSFAHYETWANLFDRFVQGPADSNLWAVPTDIGHYFGHVMPKDVYYPTSEAKFEDMMIQMPHNPHEYLKNQYGDYMQIPPVEDREKHFSVGFSVNVKEDLERGIDIYKS
ncbi:LicD family protein [Allofustis seminis]|uniref:LicD family protein n=1 Tax=Allofustis seminis TaxID=166939 RepID=UPI00035FAB87|nr:LicD family protein [Allofustis seminis]